ncbi:hypothetical protein [Viridibacillus soli]|nr:hypothetical protein [Viridibacillus soli]
MKKEDLIALGITAEQADKFISDYATTIPKTSFDEVNIEKNNLN